MEIPSEDVNPDEIAPGANLQGQDLSMSDLSQANLTGADLSGADLSNSDLTEANFRGANLSGANLFAADLTNANLSDANLTNVDIRDANLSGIYVTLGTQIDQLTQIEQDAETAQDWNQIVHVYRDLKYAFADHGLVRRARRYRSLERRAIGYREKAAGNIGSFVEIVFLRSLFDIGVSQVGFLMLGLYSLSTLYYAYIGVENALYYSIVVFTTATSATQPPTGILTQLVVMIETFGGTLLIVTWGAVISSRIE